LLLFRTEDSRFCFRWGARVPSSMARRRWCCLACSSDKSKVAD